MTTFDEIIRIADEIKSAAIHCQENQTIREFHPHEYNEEELEEGESAIQQQKEFIANLKQMIDKQFDLMKLMKKCKKRKQGVCRMLNRSIDNVLSLKKHLVEKQIEQNPDDRNEIEVNWRTFKDEKDDMREESSEQKNKRETREMLDEVKKEKEETMEMLVEIRQRQKELKEFEEKKKQVDDDIANLKDDNRKMNEANKTELKQEIEGIVNEKEKKMNERIQTTESNIDRFQNDFVKKSDISFLQQFNLDLAEMTQLQHWTGKTCCEVVFDTERDGYPKENSTEFEQKIKNRSQLLFVIEEEKGNKFGGYINAKIDKVESWITDSKAFFFSLQSNGRLNGMMKFDIQVRSDRKGFLFVSNFL